MAVSPVSVLFSVTCVMAVQSVCMCLCVCVCVCVCLCVNGWLSDVCCVVCAGVTPL